VLLPGLGLPPCGATVIIYCLLSLPGSCGREFRGNAAIMNILVFVLIYVIEPMFIAGILGSAIVVTLSSIEDFKMLFEMVPSSPGNRNQERN
jgi:hypothetical protein